MKKALRLSMGLVCVAMSALAAEPLYQQNFEKAEVGSVPDGLLVIDGNFAVEALDDGKVLELPGAPLDTFGTLFGPSRPDNTEVTARIFATKTGRKYPAFAVSLNGVGGYRLKVAPAKAAVEIVKTDATQKTVPFDWKSGEWTSLKLRVVKVGSGFKIEGKVWQGAEEPKDWTLTMEVADAPPPGKPGVWGMPFSGTPIRFDDLVVTEAE